MLKKIAKADGYHSIAWHLLGDQSRNFVTSDNHDI